MKPIRLKMTAFGPYKDEEVIDFTKLQERKLLSFQAKREREKRRFSMPSVLRCTVMPAGRTGKNRKC